jgi:hypothetical protein
MKHLKTYEEHTAVEYVAPEREQPSYKNEIKKKKRKKRGELGTVNVLPNHVKDVISFKTYA